MNGQELAKLLISSSLAFLAFLPSAIGLLLSTYDRERYSEFSGRRWELGWHRRAILAMVAGMHMIVLVYLLSLEKLIHYTDYLLAPSWPTFTLLNIGTFLLTSAIILMAAAMTIFIYRYFVELGDLTPLGKSLSDILSCCKEE